MIGEESAAKCKSCGAEIIWASLDGEKSVPLNARRVRGYTVSFPPDRLGCCAAPTPELVYVSHFTTCPQASEWSKGKAKG